ncbi:alpha/beta-hydrolase [Trichoderma sp. SZMC 28013]
MDPATVSAHDQALSYISDPRFSQEFILPRTSARDSITVCYADLGFKPETPTASRCTPTVLFIPGMFGSRYIGSLLDPVARKFGVRVVVIDRPGMGLSTRVPLSQRLSTWIEIVPPLLAHLDIEHIALISHSFGVMYLLNTLHHYRNMLHPERPFVAFMAPWVDPAHSKLTLWKMAQHIPTQAISLMNRITPAFATSGTIFTKASSFLSSSLGGGDGQELSFQEINRKKLATDYDLPRDVQLELGPMRMKKIFEGDTTGANDEALQCLRKGDGSSWGECDDYNVFVKTFVSAERQKQQLDANSQGHAKLKMRAYFAESDVMIGTEGQKYFEQCWGWQENTFEDVIDFSSSTVAGTDHDSVMESIEVLEKLFKDVKGSLT